MSALIIGLNLLDLFLSAGGNILGVGAAMDIITVIINIILGDMLGIILSLISIIPLIGNVTGVMKVIYRLIKVIRLFV